MKKKNNIEELIEKKKTKDASKKNAAIKQNAANLEEKIAKRFSQCEVTSIYGGQPVYYYLIGVE